MSSTGKRKVKSRNKPKQKRRCYFNEELNQAIDDIRTYDNYLLLSFINVVFIAILYQCRIYCCPLSISYLLLSLSIYYLLLSFINIGSLSALLICLLSIRSHDEMVKSLTSAIGIQYLHFI